MEKKPLIWPKNTMFCSKILGETSIFNWGDRRDLNALTSFIWLGLTWHGLAWLGLAWSGLVWSGLVWSGLVWSGLVWSGLVWSGLVWSGLVWSGLVWSGLAWLGLVQYVRLYKRAGELRELEHSWCRLNACWAACLQDSKALDLRCFFSVFGIFSLQFSSLAVLSSRKQLEYGLFFSLEV